MRFVAIALAASLLLATGCGGRRGLSEQPLAESDNVPPLIIAWIRCPAADALQELARDYERETDTPVYVVQYSRQSYHDQVVSQFQRKVTDFHIVVGLSTWLAKNVEGENYADLSDLLKRDVGMTDMHRGVRAVLGEYPVDSGNYFAAPCYPDPLGLVYRRDWFADASERAAFQAKYGYELAPPTDWRKLRDIAEFFHRPKDGRFGVGAMTGRNFDGLITTFRQVLDAFGGALANPETSQVGGYLDSPAALQAIDLIRELIALGPPGAAEADLNAVIGEFVRGRTAMAIGYFSTFEGVWRTMPDAAGFARIPAGPGGRGVAVEGYGISVSTKIADDQQERAKEFLQWFLSADVQRLWAEKAVLAFRSEQLGAAAESLRKRPYGAAYAESLDHLMGDWTTPIYPQLQRHLQKYIGDAVDGYIEPDKALADLVEQCGALLRDEGLLREF